VPVYVLVAPVLFWSSILVSGALFVRSHQPFHDRFPARVYARAGAWMCIAIVVWLALVGISVLGPAALVYLWTKQYQLSLSLSSIGAGSLRYSVGARPVRSWRRRAHATSAQPKRCLPGLPSLAAPVFPGGTAFHAGTGRHAAGRERADIHHAPHAFHTFHVLTSAGWKAMATPAVPGDRGCSSISSRT
jgi:hypothetical protein